MKSLKCKRLIIPFRMTLKLLQIAFVFSMQEIYGIRYDIGSFFLVIEMRGCS